MPKNMAKMNIADFSEIEKDMLADLLHIIVGAIVREVCND